MIDETPHAGNAPPQPDPIAPPPLPQATGSELTSFPVVALIILHYLTCGVFSLVYLNLLHGRLPRVRSDDPSAGKAVGFCFIPFFNLYWFFFTFRRLCLRLAEERERYGLPPNDQRGMATTNCIFLVIPYVNALIGYTIITPIFIGRLQASVNELAATSATTRPRSMPASPPAQRGMPGWALALIVCGCLLPFIFGLLAALLLPALASAKKKAETINCVNNLKQVGLAFRIWEGDHGDQFPFNVSTNQGGTLELCDAGEDGLDRNSWMHFQVMSNELATPRILYCPADLAKQSAADFTHFGAENVSYLIHTGTNVTGMNPETVLAVCPFHCTVLYCDGSVGRLTKSQMSSLMDSLKHP